MKISKNVLAAFVSRVLLAAAVALAVLPQSSPVSAGEGGAITRIISEELLSGEEGRSFLATALRNPEIAVTLADYLGIKDPSVLSRDPEWTRHALLVKLTGAHDEAIRKRAAELLGIDSSTKALSVATQRPCVSDECRSIADLKAESDGVRRLPRDITDKELEGIAKEYADDGRPILFFTDSRWTDKSGVVTVKKVLKSAIFELTGKNVEVKFVTPDDFPTGINLNYQDIRLAWAGSKALRKIIYETNPQAVHIAVEGALGLQAQIVLNKAGIPFTTAYHTEMPDYVAEATRKVFPPFAGLMKKISVAYFRWFHSKSQGIMVPTDSMVQGLLKDGYNPEQIRYWSHGVEIDRFKPEFRDPDGVFAGLPRPISLYIGRIAPEKNLEDFLAMDIPGSKVLIGPGPDIQILRNKYPKAVFLGRRDYEELPKYYASADVFVFPSLTDTFGLVQLEALAAGTPVVAYNVRGPKDVIVDPKVGTLAEYRAGASGQNVANLTQAWHTSIGLSRQDARAYAEDHTWDRSALEFLYFLQHLPRGATDKFKPRK